MGSLSRFREPLTRDSLVSVLSGETLATDELHHQVDLEALAETLKSQASTAVGSQLDGQMVEAVHLGLNSLGRADAADMRLWHWLCASEFSWLVWIRWSDTIPTALEDVRAAVTPAMLTRFAGSNSLSGISRNTLARLWWVAEQLDGDYDLARRALARQDMFQAVFEREMSLHPPVPRACLRVLAQASEAEIRRATRHLNYVATTTALEALDERQIEAILSEALDRR